MLLCLYTVLSIRAGNQPLNQRKNLRACSAEEFSFCLKKRGGIAACVNVKIK
jgi:putative hemolysin